MSTIYTIIAALTGAAVFEYLRIPAGAMVGSMVAIASMKLSLPATIIHLPTAAKFIAFTAIGWMIGETISRSTVRLIMDNSLALFGSAVVLLLLGGLLAVIVAKFGFMDPATSFLATSPGGLSQMAALSASIGAETPLVVTVHVLRVSLVLLMSPLVLRLLPAPH